MKIVCLFLFTLLFQSASLINPVYSEMEIIGAEDKIRGEIIGRIDGKIGNAPADADIYEVIIEYEDHRVNVHYVIYGDWNPKYRYSVFFSEKNEIESGVLLSFDTNHTDAWLQRYLTRYEDPLFLSYVPRGIMELGQGERGSVNRKGSVCSINGLDPVIMGDKEHTYIGAISSGFKYSPEGIYYRGTFDKEPENGDALIEIDNPFFTYGHSDNESETTINKTPTIASTSTNITSNSTSQTSTIQSEFDNRETKEYISETVDYTPYYLVTIGIIIAGALIAVAVYRKKPRT
jgi:hypothetical protein